ncbi:hypothetical protein ACFSTC_51270 [Nonomuraea ferruginea]
MPVAGETRTTLVVAEPAAHTLFNEPGPTVGEDEFADFLRTYEALLREARAVVLSGSLPRGLPVTTYATLAAFARDRGCPRSPTPTASRSATRPTAAPRSSSPTPRSWPGPSRTAARRRAPRPCATAAPGR